MSEGAFYLVANSRSAHRPSCLSLFFPIVCAYITAVYQSCTRRYLHPFRRYKARSFPLACAINICVCVYMCPLVAIFPSLLQMIYSASVRCSWADFCRSCLNPILFLTFKKKKTDCSAPDFSKQLKLHYTEKKNKY